MMYSMVKPSAEDENIFATFVWLSCEEMSSQATPRGKRMLHSSVPSNLIGGPSATNMQIQAQITIDVRSRPDAARPLL